MVIAHFQIQCYKIKPFYYIKIFLVKSPSQETLPSLIQPKDVLNLKDLIIKLYENEDLCKKLGNYGHNRVVDLFNWSKNAKIYRKLLKNTIEEYYSKKLSFNDDL